MAMSHSGRYEPFVIQKPQHEGWLDDPMCSLCLQHTLRETAWEVVRHCAGSTIGYVLCPDCAFSFSDEPWRAWHEADEWSTMLQQNNVAEEGGNP